MATARPQRLKKEKKKTQTCSKRMASSEMEMCWSCIICQINYRLKILNCTILSAKQCPNQLCLFLLAHGLHSQSTTWAIHVAASCWSDIVLHQDLLVPPAWTNRPPEPHQTWKLWPMVYCKGAGPSKAAQKLTIISYSRYCLHILFI